MTGPERVYEVALFGVTGCGKSSVINSLADKQVADVSTGVEACTRRARWYPVSLGEKNFRLWDTTGFNQAEAKDTEDINPLSPYEQAHALLRNLQNGIDLILICARKDGINTSLRSLYWLLDSFFFGGRAQIALVLTHFDTPDDGWWARNGNTIAQKCNIPVQFLPYVCITTVQDGPSQPGSLYEQSRQALAALLEEHTTLNTPTPLSLNLSSDTAITAAVDSLNIYCHLSNPQATALVEKFNSPKRPFRAILFGASGAGKSSVINLVVGRSVAVVSSGINSCTLDYEKYDVHTGSHQLLIWDTVGLDGTDIGHSVFVKAVENAVHLIQDLQEQGGVDLLLFCKREGRLSTSELNNFRLFNEFLCEGQIPVAFIITHLEHKESMEEWWKENGKGLIQALDLKADAVAGHTCITSLSPEGLKDRRLHEQRSKSKQLVEAMLDESISYGSAFTQDKEIWVMAFLKKLIGMVRVGQPSWWEERTAVKNLTSRCGLSKEQAKEVVKLLCNTRS